MHEHTFIQSIINQVPNADKVISIELELGELVGIEADHLKEHLEDETSWKVLIYVKKARIKCTCGYIGEPKILQRLHDLVIYECPQCENDNVIVLEGKDIKIGKVEYK